MQKERLILFNGRISKAGLYCAGFTIVEVMAAVAITIVVALGTLCYQYYSVKHSRAAQAQTTGTRIGQLILEDWKSTGGDPDYDSEELGLGFIPTDSGEFGSSLISLDNQTFFANLQRSEIAHDDVAGVTLLELAVTIRWRLDYIRGPISVDDPTVVLTTYARRDQ